MRLTQRVLYYLPHLGIALCITGLLVGAVSADPPASGEDNGLTENESATLWSHDRDEYVPEDVYQNQSNQSRSPMAQLANGTDFSFTQPPATAATWTRHDFEDLSAGDSEISVHPTHADLEDGVLIQDAHATVFAVHPSTRGHLTPSETPLYVAPNGSVRALVDYRVRLPSANNTRGWTVTSHEVEEIRLVHDETTIARVDGTQTPVIDYRLAEGGAGRLTVEADIAVTVGNGVATRNETLTVSDTLDIVVYDLTAYPHETTYPNGDAGIAIFQTQPWQGYTLGDNASVRGVWRFYTARDRRWDTLTTSTATDDREVDSPALPVYVHAYPSRIGPRAEPLRDGPEILEVWGVDHRSPNATLGENVSVEVVEQSYVTSYGVAVRADTIDRDELAVAGIVRGVNATIVDPGGGAQRTIRQSALTVRVVSQSSSEATLRVELRDEETGEPIALAAHPRLEPLGADTRTGYITIAGERVETNSTGVALVTVEQPGIYTATYHPGSWLSADPTYTSATASVRWHPLGTIDGWLALVVDVLWLAAPFVVALYAGQRLLMFLPGGRIDR